MPESADPDRNGSAPPPPGTGASQPNPAEAATHPGPDRGPHAGPETGPEAADEGGPPPTPFENPWFLPVMLLLLAFCLGYDGFLNQDFAAEHPEDAYWNRQVGAYFLLWALGGFFEAATGRFLPYLFPILTALLGVWFAWDGYRNPAFAARFPEMVPYYRAIAWGLFALAAVSAIRHALHSRRERSGS